MLRASNVRIAPYCRIALQQISDTRPIIGRHNVRQFVPKTPRGGPIYDRHSDPSRRPTTISQTTETHPLLNCTSGRLCCQVLVLHQTGAPRAWVATRPGAACRKPTTRHQPGRCAPGSLHDRALSASIRLQPNVTKKLGAARRGRYATRRCAPRAVPNRGATCRGRGKPGRCTPRSLHHVGAARRYHNTTQAHAMVAAQAETLRAAITT